MSVPLFWLDSFWLPAIITLILEIVILAVNYWRLVTPEAHRGIFSLQVASWGEWAGEILNSWSKEQRRLAATLIGGDFVFILLYTYTLYTACGWTAQCLNSVGAGFWAGVGLFLTFLIVLAAGCDFIENILTLKMLNKKYKPFDEGDSLPRLTSFFGFVKFLFIGFGLTYLLVFGPASVVYCNR